MQILLFIFFSLIFSFELSYAEYECESNINTSVVNQDSNYDRVYVSDFNEFQKSVDYNVRIYRPVIEKNVIGQVVRYEMINRNSSELNPNKAQFWLKKRIIPFIHLSNIFRVFGFQFYTKFDSSLNITRPSYSGSNVFKFGMKIFDNRIDAIRGFWSVNKVENFKIVSDNMVQYYLARLEGKSFKEASLSTWTGQQASNFGFLNPVIENDPFEYFLEEFNKYPGYINFLNSKSNDLLSDIVKEFLELNYENTRFILLVYFFKNPI